MLPGTRLSYDARLAQPAGKQHLPQRIVNLVSTRVVEILALQQDSRTISGTQLTRLIERRRPPHIILQQQPILQLEILTLNDAGIRPLQVLSTFVQHLGHKGTAKLTIITILVNVVTHNLLSF